MEKEKQYHRKSWVPSDTETQEQEEAVFFNAIIQAGKTADFINIHFKDGKQKALPASSISQMDYIPEDGTITLYCGYAEVTVTGKNLEELYRKLLALKITEIREFCSLQITADYNQLVISKIEMESTLDQAAD